MVKNILFYYHHFGGLGHGMRIYALCKAINFFSPDYKMLVINSGVAQPELDIERYAKVINLPYFKAGHGLFSGLYSPEGLEITFRRRRKILKRIADKIKFHIAIFEHFPFGRDSLQEEITEFINYLRAKDTPIYSSVRDIITQTIYADLLRRRLELFKGIFVHSDREMGFLTGLRKSSFLEKKMIFTGRVFPIDKKELEVKKTVKDRLKYKGKKLILISSGGGIDGVDIAEKLIEIKDEIDKKFSSFYLISAGPSIDEDNFEKLHELIKNRRDIIIEKFIQGYPNYINAADLYISMGGYNSINNVLFTGAKAIIFPRQSDNEQKLRTKYFSGFFNIGSYKDYKSNLAAKIINIISRKKPHIEYKGNFKGADITARLIERIFNLDYIKIRLSTKCNLHCDMCSVKHQRCELGFSKVKQIIDQANILNIKSINFTGGEPTLHPQFYNLIRYVKKQGFSVSVSTNGIIKDCGIVYLSKYCDYIDMSINSHKEELDDKIRARTGAFKNSINFIKQLNNLNNDIWLHINVTIRPDNYENIHKIIQLLSKYIDSISFTLVDTSINKLDCLKFKKDQLLSFYFNEVPLILKECIKNKVKLRITPFFKDLQNLNNRERLKRLLTNTKYYLSKFKSIFEITSISLCQRAKSDLRVNANGWICPCCYLDDYPINLGNIYNKSLLEIVSSDEYFNFIASARPNRGWCKKCAIGYKIYAKFFK